MGCSKVKGHSSKLKGKIKGYGVDYCVSNDCVNQSFDFLEVSIGGNQLGAELHCLRCNPYVVGRNRRSLLFELKRDSGVAV